MVLVPHQVVFPAGGVPWPGVLVCDSELPVGVRPLGPVAVGCAVGVHAVWPGAHPGVTTADVFGVCVPECVYEMLGVAADSDRWVFGGGAGQVVDGAGVQPRVHWPLPHRMTWQGGMYSTAIACMPLALYQTAPLFT